MSASSLPRTLSGLASRALSALQSRVLGGGRGPAGGLAPGTYTADLIAAQTTGIPLRIHVSASVVDHPADEGRCWLVSGWWHSREAHRWTREEVPARDALELGVLRCIREVLHHTRQRGVSVEIVLDESVYEHLHGLVELACTRLRAGEGVGDLGAGRALNQSLRCSAAEFHRRGGAAVLGAGTPAEGLRTLLADAAAVNPTAPAGGGGILRNDPNHAQLLRNWARANGYTVCHADGSHCPERERGGWAWWADANTWEAGRVGGKVNCNEMELRAVCEALTHCSPGAPLLVLTDSAHVLRLLEGDTLLPGAKKLRSLVSARDARVLLVKGHHDTGGHSLADTLARAAVRHPRKALAGIALHASGRAGLSGSVREVPA